MTSTSTVDLHHFLGHYPPEALDSLEFQERKNVLLQHRLQFATHHVGTTEMYDYMEYRDGKTAKYWELEVRGPFLRVYWGSLGSDGQSKTKNLSTHDEALNEGQKLQKQKAAKGYRRCEKPLTASYGLMADCTLDTGTVLHKTFKHITKKPDEFLLDICRSALSKRCWDMNKEIFADTWEDYHEELAAEYNQGIAAGNHNDDIKRKRITPLNDEDFRYGFVSLKETPPENLLALYFKAPRDALGFSFDLFDAKPPVAFKKDFRNNMIEDLCGLEVLEVDENYKEVRDASGSLIIINDMWPDLPGNTFSYAAIDNSRAKKQVIHAMIAEAFSVRADDRQRTYVASNNLTYFSIGRPYFFPILVVERANGDREVAIFSGCNEI